jgi:hypothetical protein
VSFLSTHNFLLNRPTARVTACQRNIAQVFRFRFDLNQLPGRSIKLKRPTRTLHGSSANRSAFPRTLFIANLASADAIPLSTNAIPSNHSGMIIHGKEPGTIRTTAYEMETPEVPKGASFFNQQEVNPDK